MSDILVQDDAVQHLGLLDFTAGNLFNTGIALNVHFGFASAFFFDSNTTNSVQSKLTHQVAPRADEFCADGGFDKCHHFFSIVDIHRVGDVLDDL